MADLMHGAFTWQQQAHSKRHIQVQDDTNKLCNCHAVLLYQLGRHQAVAFTFQSSLLTVSGPVSDLGLGEFEMSPHGVIQATQSVTVTPRRLQVQIRLLFLTEASSALLYSSTVVYLVNFQLTQPG